MMKTEGGGMRQPVFEGLRSDKEPKDFVENESCPRFRDFSSPDDSVPLLFAFRYSYFLSW